MSKEASVTAAKLNGAQRPVVPSMISLCHPERRSGVCTKGFASIEITCFERLLEWNWLIASSPHRVDDDTQIQHVRPLSEDSQSSTCAVQDEGKGQPLTTTIAMANVGFEGSMRHASGSNRGSTKFVPAMQIPKWDETQSYRGVTHADETT